MNSSEPFFEVHYAQDDHPGGPADPFCPIDWKRPPKSWEYSVVLQSDHFHRMVRVRNEKLQRLTVVGHHAPSGYYLYLPENQSVASLLHSLMKVEPISDAEDHFTVPVGKYGDRFYVRAVGWNSLPEMFSSGAVGGILDATDTDIVQPITLDPRFDRDLAWWLVLFDELTQDAFQEANHRLDVLVQWMYQIQMHAHDWGLRYLRKQVREIESSGWPKIAGPG